MDQMKKRRPPSDLFLRNCLTLSGCSHIHCRLYCLLCLQTYIAAKVIILCFRKRAVSISKSQRMCCIVLSLSMVVQSASYFTEVLHKALSFLEQPSEHNPHEERRQKLVQKNLFYQLPFQY